MRPERHTLFFSFSYDGTVMWLISAAQQYVITLIAQERDSIVSGSGDDGQL
jgi:hypothetical protein